MLFVNFDSIFIIYIISDPIHKGMNSLSRLFHVSLTLSSDYCVLLTLNCDADEDLISPASEAQKEKIDLEILLEVMFYVL